LIVDRKVFAWAMYDWANSAFALSVLAVLFPLFLGSYWSVGDDGSSVTARLAWITAGASAIVSVLAPVFGTIADAGGYRKRFLLFLALLGASMTAALGLVGEGDWPWALVVYLIASIGFYSSTVFYDSLIIDVTEPGNYKFVSAFGFSLGYLGGAILLALHVWMLTSPETFGFASSVDAMKFAFVSVGIWWAVFLIPLIVFVPESKRAAIAAGGAVIAAYKELKATFTRIRRYRNISLFLLAY
jgi:UMF1 family MFS transporter